MSIRLNFCRSVPPEFLWSFFLLTTTYVSPYENARESKNIWRTFLLKLVFLQTNTGFLTICVILRGFACYRNHWLSHHQWTICGVWFQRSLTLYTSRTTAERHAWNSTIPVESKKFVRMPILCKGVDNFSSFYFIRLAVTISIFNRWSIEWY